MDLQVIKTILNLFGHASGLHTNLSKSLVSPIHCSHNEMLLTTEILSCSVKDFSCTYLGLPLSIHKPIKEVLLPLIDKVADRLPGWKTSLMNRAGRLVMVWVVLTATPIYSMMAMDLPKWVIKAIDKRRVFFGKDRNTLMGVTALFRGKGSSGHWNMEDWGFLICKLLAGHCKFVGCGLRRRTRPNFGLGSKFRYQKMIMLCSTWQWIRLWEMVNPLFFGRTDGYMATPSRN
jgi:hypothetical protein